jgi:hypothetical protein
MLNDVFKDNIKFSAELLGILKWRDCMSDLDKNLDKMMNLQGGEIMKV